MDLFQTIYVCRTSGSRGFHEIWSRDYYDDDDVESTDQTQTSMKTTAERCVRVALALLRFRLRVHEMSRRCLFGSVLRSARAIVVEIPEIS